MQITKTKIPEAEGKVQPRITAVPLADRIEKISELLQHKRVCHVLNDASFGKSFHTHTAISYDATSKLTINKFLIGTGDPIPPQMQECSMTITSMSVFLSMLPERSEHEEGPKAPSLAKDLIILESPVSLEKDAFEQLKDGLAVFKCAHPYAAIVAGKPTDENAALQMGVLVDERVVDEVGTADYETSTQLLYRGTVMLEQKLATAVVDGKAVQRASSEDPKEIVLVEPIQ